MQAKRYKPQAIITIHTDTQDLILRISSNPQSAMDNDVLSIHTERDMGADSPIFSIVLSGRKPWHLWVTSNDLITIEMWRPPEARKLVFMGLVDDVRKKVVVQDDKPQRTITITGRGVSKAFVQFQLGQMPEVEDLSYLGALSLSLGSTLSGLSPSELIDLVWEKIAKPNANYQFSSGGLFDKINKDTSSIDGVKMMNGLSLLNWQKSMWAFLVEVSDSPFHELFWEIGQDNKPTLYLRPTPFSEGRWKSLEQITDSDDNVVIDEIGRSDVETYTVYSVGMKIGGTSSNPFNTFGLMPIWHEPYSKKYGTRRLHIESLYAAYQTREDRDGVTTIVKKFQEDLYNWNIKNNSMFNGTVLVKGSNKYRVGMRWVYQSTENGTTIEFYIKSVSHDFINFGSWLTVLGVTRGCISKDRFTPPYGEGKPFTGVPWMATLENPIVVDAVTGDLIPTATGGANSVVAFAESFIGIAHYIYGADNADTKTWDCSSFMQYVFKQAANISIGRTTYQQDRYGVPVSRRDLKPGNLIFAGDPTTPYQHVGMYVGNGMVLDNSGGRGGVGLSDLDTGWFGSRFTEARDMALYTKGQSRYLMIATGYTLAEGSGTGLTANGSVPMEGRTIAVDKSIIPLGTTVRVECTEYPSVNGDYVAEDTGGDIKGARVDIYFGASSTSAENIERALDFGRRPVSVTVL